jgi:sn-glycerol 3-phosphate transport system permease protein
MVERTPFLDVLTQVLLFLALLTALAPFAIVAIAATHDLRTVNQVPMPLMPGHDFMKNAAEAWDRADLGRKIVNSILFAGGVALGKVVIAGLSAFSLVFFRYRALMLPLEIRIVPTYAVAANVLSPYQTLLDLTGISWLFEKVTSYRITLHWGLLNTYTGLILPLIATATGTFLYRQFFRTIPDELVEAAKMDGAGALRFLKDILLPLSKTNMAALGTIMFVWAWNQYLWPLLVTTDSAHGTAVMELKELIPGSFGIPDWNVAMAGTLIIMLPPLVVVILMQRWFVRGLIATEK